MDTLNIEPTTSAKPKRVIPQGYTERDELVAIRELLRLDRTAEAKERLEILLDRYHGTWRVG